MDFSNAEGIECRVVKDDQHLGQPVRVVSGSRTYQVAIEEVWEAVTDSKRLPLWFAPISGDLKLGGRYQLEGNAGGNITCCDAPRAFDITWEYGGTSWVRVRLATADGGARLTLEQLIAKEEANEAHWKKYGPGATGVGWELGFLALGLHLQSGEAVIDSDIMESPQGTAFIESCAGAWADAHILAGEDPTVALAMAAKTAAFYCGH